MRKFLALGALALATAAVLPTVGWAQLAADNPDWKESDAPPAPQFDMARLLSFDVAAASSLRFGVDPATISITPDGLVRYVVVASNSSGAMNAMYEGVRCATSEVRTYARFTTSGGWKPVVNSDWQSLAVTTLPRHSSILAKLAFCTGGRAPQASVDRIVRTLKGTLNESKN